MLIFYENVDNTLAFREKQILPQCDSGPRVVRLILTELHDFFKFKSRFQTQTNSCIWSYNLVYLGFCILKDKFLKTQ